MSATRATATILIVDDHPANLKLARVLLAGEGYRVLTAENAPQALAIADRDRPDLILLDIQLPGMDGLEAARRLKNNPATTGAIIIAMTAYAMKGDEKRIRAAGCDGYITK